jgi:WD40 repeat protein/serine/threonine protein kinase
MSQPPVDHPNADVLRALSLGQLAEAELTRAIDHLRECPACCRRIDELTAGDALVAQLQRSAASSDEVLASPDERRSAVHALRRRQEARAGLPGIIPVPKQVGDYDILGEVGRGGMGVVYKARHRSLHRLAALKMVLAGEFSSATQQLRFRLEAELAARVHHPDIVQLYEIGTHEGRPFLALEWVEGGSLASRLDGKPWLPAEAAALIETLARAIHVAHSEGIVHRDLKPANILLSGKSEIRNPKSETNPNIKIQNPKPAAAAGSVIRTSNLESVSDFEPRISDFVPKITDFGLAQPTEGGMTLTQSGFLVGTPGYMAPEQAGGKRALVGPATDIYALGVVLYQLLTGQLPFQGDSTLDVLRAVTNDEPVRLRRLQPRIPRDLEAITLHCLEKEPALRYPSALALAEDLERFREGKQVVARPVGAIARLARACRQRPLVASLVTLLLVSLLGGLAGVTWKWTEANANARKATDKAQEAQFQTYRARIAAAAAALSAHDVADVARQLKETPQELRDWEWRHLSSRLDDSSSVVPWPGPEAGLLPGAPDRLRAWALTRAGLLLADLESGERKLLPIGAEGRRRITVAQTRRGLRFVACVGKTSLDLLDEAGQPLCRVELPEATDIYHVVLSPDGTRLAVIADDWKGRLVVFDTTSGKQLAICAGHNAPTYALTFSPDGTRLASGSEDKTARLWDTASGELLATCRGHKSRIYSIAFRPDGARFLTTSSDETVRQWDAASGKELGAPYERHGGGVVLAVYSPDGEWVASTGIDRTVRVWQATLREDVAILHGHTGPVVSLAFAPDGRRLASFSSEATRWGRGDGTVRLWEVDPRATLPVLRGHKRAIYPVALSPDGRWIASGDADGEVRLWDAVTGELCAALPHPSIVQALAWSPDGTWLVTNNVASGGLLIWDAATARVRKEIIAPDSGVYFVTVSPDGRRVAVTTFDPKSNKRRLHVGEIASGEWLFSAEGTALAYSPDGRWLAVQASDQRTVLLLDARTHETAAQFAGHDDYILSATFSPDSRLLASCSRDRTVRLWQVDPLTLPSPPGEGGEGRMKGCRVLRGHTDEVFAAAFHPDGRRLATGGWDRAVWLWDLERGEEVARLRGHTSFIWSLAFSRDGATLVSGSGDATVRLWDTAPLKKRYDARREAASLRPEAQRLVEQLWRQKNDPAAVVDALRADGALTEPLRHAALREVLRKTQPPEAAPGNPDDPP